MAKPLENMDWKSIRIDYFSGIKPQEIAKKYNINYSTLTNKIYRENWQNELREITQNVGERLADKEVEAIHLMRQKEREDTDLIIEAIKSQLLLNDQINPELNAQDVKSLSGAYKDIQQIKYKSFGIKENEEEKQSITINIDGIDAKL